ncbi:MAG: hypothetical protein Q9219_004529 [cf. Caloplaca sp. 3 TL-2023]
MNDTSSVTNADGIAADNLQENSSAQGKNGYQFRGSDPDSDEDERDGLSRRYQAQRNGEIPPPRHFNNHDQRGGLVKYSKIPMPISAISPQDSADGYDSFENTNNKKKRKIPNFGSSGGHHSSLSADMAHMGISSNRDYEVSQSDTDGDITQYYDTSSLATAVASSGSGISGAGRGRYGRGVARAPSGRSPLGVSTNGSNAALQAGRQLLQKQEFSAVGQSSNRDSASHSTSNQGIISAAIANAISLPSTVSRGQENVSLLERQASKKPSGSKTQFTFTCESDSGKNMAWQEQPPAHSINPAYNTVPASNLHAMQVNHQSRDFATQGTQTSPGMASGTNHEATPQGAGSQQTQQQPKKPRRSLAKQLAVAAKQRRLQQEYDNYHHPPGPEDTWICEFCEYEMIFGSAPEALIRHYEIKDRHERRRLAEKRRLLEKAKMKGRKGKKGTKNASKNANAASTAQQSAAKQRYEQPPDSSLMPNQSSQPEDYLGTGYDEDPPPVSAPLPQTPSRIPQPGLFTRIGPIHSLSLRFDRAGRSSGTAYVTYQYLSDARLAIREFDGANAHGQPIRLALLPVPPSNDIHRRAAPARNPFDTVERPSRSLFDRIDGPQFGSEGRTRAGRSRSRSPGKPRRSDVSKPAPEGVDRYVPPRAARSRVRSRSPGRREDTRGRARGGRERRGGRTENAGARPRKTQEELDKDMEDYWGPTAEQNDNGASTLVSHSRIAASTTPAVVGDEDVDMGVE